jgi:hypothetical protein
METIPAAAKIYRWLGVPSPDAFNKFPLLLANQPVLR